MKILITGATGYLGSYVADHLAGEGYGVRLSARAIPSYMNDWAKRFEVSLGDVLDADYCECATRGVDAIIHFAALNEVECEKSPELSARVNGIGTYNMLSGASKNRIDRFYYISTFHVYGVPEGGVITEDTIPHPVSHYAISHLLAEMYCHRFFIKEGLYHNIVRISNGYGAPLFKEIDRWTLVLNDFCRTAATKKKIILKSDGTQKRDFVSLRDISRALRVLIDSEKTKERVFNIGGEDLKSIRELAEIASRVYQKEFNEKIEVVFPQGTAAAAQNNGSFIFDISRIKGMGFSPQPKMEDEVRKLIRMCHEAA